ncbi:MAG: T9SS type A sorting domain-containing protein [Crocinitomicaceae bacterium]|nr:T9SS type A sorting domain-containing protein [Crocinitomicaceae bacterium]
MKYFMLTCCLLFVSISFNHTFGQFTLPPDDGSVVNCPIDGLVQPAEPGVITDGCANTLVPIVTAPTAVPCEGDMIWIFTYSGCNETHIWTYTYTVDMPGLTIGAANGSSIVVTVNDANTQPVPPVITDVCGNILTPVVIGPNQVPGTDDYTWTFVYTDCAGNTVDWVFTYTVDPTSSTHESDLDEFTSIYPNPASNELTINVSSAEQIDYELMNSYGQVVLAGNSISSSTTLDVSSFSDGIYYITVHTNSGIITKKVLKQ